MTTSQQHPDSGKFVTAADAARPAEAADRVAREQRQADAVAELAAPVSAHERAIAAPSVTPDGSTSAHSDA